jgi:uncharacterized protein (DUF488 family)
MAISTFCTIGYAGKDIEQFVQKLLNANITTLVDVRQLPLSRKHDFSKTRLQSHLKDSGIEYKHIGILGSPKELRHKVREDKDFDSFFSEYQNYLDTKTEALDNLLNEIEKKKSCLMCVESEPTFCHRQIIARNIEKKQPGLKVVHL